jgi:hypothetical protein
MNGETKIIVQPQITQLVVEWLVGRHSILLHCRAFAGPVRWGFRLYWPALIITPDNALPEGITQWIRVPPLEPYCQGITWHIKNQECEWGGLARGKSERSGVVNRRPLKRRKSKWSKTSTMSHAALLFWPSKCNSTPSWHLAWQQHYPTSKITYFVFSSFAHKH